MTNSSRSLLDRLLAPSTRWFAAGAGMIAGVASWYIGPHRPPEAPLWHAVYLVLTVLAGVAAALYAVSLLRDESADEHAAIAHTPPNDR